MLELTPEQLALESICLDFAEGERGDLIRGLGNDGKDIQFVWDVGGG